jgi:hypothetical protein
MCAPANLVCRTLTHAKSDKKNEKLSSPEMVSNSRTNPYSCIIYERFLVTSNFEVYIYIYNRSMTVYSVVSIVTRLYGSNDSGFNSRQEIVNFPKTFHVPSLQFIEYWRLFPAGRMPESIG